MLKFGLKTIVGVLIVIFLLLGCITPDSTPDGNKVEFFSYWFNI